MMSSQMVRQPKLNENYMFFTLHFKFWKYVLLTTSSFVSFCFTLAFNPLSLLLPSYGNQSNDLHSRLVDWFLCGGGTGAIKGIIRECHSSQLSRTSFIAKKKKKKRKKNYWNRFSQTSYSHNVQGLLIKTRIFCRCSLITALYLFKKTYCHSLILR